MNVITKEQFERLAGLRNLTVAKVQPTITNVSFSGDLVVTNEVDDSLEEVNPYEVDAVEDDECLDCPDYDFCWGSNDEEELIEEHESCFGCESGCEDTCGEDTEIEDLDIDVLEMERVFDNGQWETVKEFIYEVLEADDLISSNKISQFISDYFDQHVSGASIAAMKANRSRK